MRWLPVLGLVLSGCSSCSSGPAVPFGLDARPGAQADDRQEPTDPVARPSEGRAFPPGTTRVEVEGASIEDEGSIRALWAHDVDGDGDRDVIAIVDSPVRVLFLRREGAGFEGARILSQAPTAEGCALTSATFAALGDRLLASAEIGCPESPDEASSERFVLDTDRTPRSLVHLGVLAAGAEGEVRITLDTDDRDEDGRDDLVVELHVTRQGRDASLTLSWLDRPSGLARDSAEPEHTLNERSREALRRLRGAPGEALARSRDVIALWEVLCREPGLARLRVGGAPGVACGESNGAGRAATTIVRAHAAMGETMAALDELARLERPGLLLIEERRDYARRALDDAPATGGLSLREGPTLITGVSGGRPRLSALGFIDESHVLLRSGAPRIWDLTSGETTPTDPSRGDRRILDPSGRFSVVAVERTCEGHVLRVTSNGAPASTPLLIEVAPPAGVECPLDEAQVRDDGGWRVLGWAPQGVLAANRGELRLVPLDVSARPAGSPSTLAMGTPPPAPLPPGAVTTDGRFHVEVRGLGVVLHSVARDAQPELLWPEGWGEREGEVSDAAVSPSGRRVAVLRGDRVYLIEKGSD